MYLDFSKAFDKVPHERLLNKIAAHGIGGNLIKWIRGWLINRKQRVCINGSKSNWGNVSSGVPQGSVLGPLLFILYINDLDIGINSSISKFADDTKIGRVIDSHLDREALQKDLDQLSLWARDWQMEFNVDKCKVMKLGRNTNVESYRLGNQNINVGNQEKDLGVIISNDLKPRQQCINACNKANRMLGFINRTVKFRNQEVILKLYLSLVRPHLDYGVQFWTPFYRMDIDRLEKVQRRMTKMIPNLHNVCYEERLKRLGLHSLERRRVRGDMIEVYKWMHGINKGDLSKVLRISSQVRTRNNGLKLEKFRFRKEIGRNWFSNRVVDMWNSLPYEVVNAESMDSMKRKLDKFMDNRGWV